MIVIHENCRWTDFKYLIIVIIYLFLDNSAMLLCFNKHLLIYGLSYSYRIMKFQLCTLVLFVCIVAINTLPLDLGNGGVYDNPEANAYWEKRFGRGFFSNLASIQRNINNVAKVNKSTLKVDKPSPIEPVVDIRTVVEEQVQNTIKDEPFMMVKAPEILTINPGPIFFEDVHF